MTSLRIVDLTQILDEEIPVWPGGRPFSRETVSDAEICVLDYRSGAGVGTHMDAPAHFVRGGRKIHELPIERCVGKGCVLHLADRIGERSDYQVLASDLLEWEAEYGRIEPYAIVLIHTGWSARWPSKERYINGLSYPSLSLEVAELLLERQVAGLGVDTLGPDAGASGFPVHKLLLGAGLFFIENLTRLSDVPARGATIFALPIPIRNGAEAYARVIAMVGP